MLHVIIFLLRPTVLFESARCYLKIMIRTFTSSPKTKTRKGSRIASGSLYAPSKKFDATKRNANQKKKKKKKNSHRSQFGCKGLLLNLTIEGRWMEQRSDVGTPYVHGKKRPAPDGDQPLVRKFGRLQIGIYPLTVTSSQ